MRIALSLRIALILRRLQEAVRQVQAIAGPGD